MVSAGWVRRARGLSSKPTTDTWFGTCRPADHDEQAGDVVALDVLAHFPGVLRLDDDLVEGQ